MTAIDIRMSGPVFNGHLGGEIDAFMEEVKDNVADQAYADVMTNLDASIVHPTPYYETQVQVERSSVDRSVNDAGVIYGPWLEGVSSRNQTTRFKGYASFRRAAQSVQERVPHLVADALRRLLGRVS